MIFFLPKIDPVFINNSLLIKIRQSFDLNHMIVWGFV